MLQAPRMMKRCSLFWSASSREPVPAPQGTAWDARPSVLGSRHAVSPRDEAERALGVLCPRLCPWHFGLRASLHLGATSPWPCGSGRNLITPAQVFLRDRAHLATPPPCLSSGPSWCPSDSGPLGSEPRASHLPNVYTGLPAGLIVSGTPASNSGFAQEQVVCPAFCHFE